MAKNDQFRQAGGNEYEESTGAEIPLPDTQPGALAKKKTGGEKELVNNPRKQTSVRRKANYAPEANAVARRASRSHKSNISSRVENSIPLQVEEKIVANNNSFKKNTLTIASLSLSCFLVIFVLFFCIIPLKQISYEVPVVYQDIEIYTEQEPYLETVYYSEKEPYNVTEAYTVSQPYTTTEPYMVYNPRPWLPPPSTGNHTRPPRPPPEPLISYREVTRYMDVTKYRDVLQYQDVQKSRNEVRFRPVQKQRTVAKVRQETRYRMVPLLYSFVA